MKVKLDKDELEVLKDVKVAFQNLMNKIRRAEDYGLTF